MAIEFNKEYVSFRVTDTLHQLVDRLNTFEDNHVYNRKLVDSNLNDLLFMVHRDSGVITADSDLTVSVDNLTLDLDGAFVSNASTFTSNSTGAHFINSTGTISLTSDQDIANVLLRSNGSTYGGLRNKSGHLEILSNLSPAVTFSVGDANFPGTITLPGNDLNTDAKDVAGAINEVHDELDSELSLLDTRVSDNTSDILSLEGRITSTETNTTSNTNRISNLEALNIADRLNSIEAQITTINNRLNILEL